LRSSGGDQARRRDSAGSSRFSTGMW
jgi:hypothetical protein